MQLIYSQEAIDDLVRLRAFTAEKDPSAAARVAEDLRARLENLRLFPHLGRAIGPAPDALQEMVFGRYVVRYSLHTQAVAILRIWHHYENRQ